jgi:hypothetical protein
MVNANVTRRIRATAVSLWPHETTGENVDLSWSVDALAEKRLSRRE